MIYKKRSKDGLWIAGFVIESHREKGWVARRQLSLKGRQTVSGSTSQVLAGPRALKHSVSSHDTTQISDFSLSRAREKICVAFVLARGAQHTSLSHTDPERKTRPAVTVCTNIQRCSTFFFIGNLSRAETLNPCIIIHKHPRKYSRTHAAN